MSSLSSPIQVFAPHLVWSVPTGARGVLQAIPVGTNWGSSLNAVSQYVLWVLSIVCSAFLVIFFFSFMDFDRYIVLRTVDPNYLIPVYWSEFFLL